MASRNDITGDLIKTKFNSEQYKENLGKIFGDTKGPQRGRWKQDPETGKMLSMRDWYAKYGVPEKPKTPMFFIDKFEPYQSMVSSDENERFITVNSRRQHEYELKKNGCRVYEGRDQELKEARRYQKYEDEKLERRVEDTLEKTYHEIEHGYRTPMETPETLNWTWGMDTNE